MRKRKYSHREEDNYYPDTLIEDVDVYWNELHRTGKMKLSHLHYNDNEETLEVNASLKSCDSELETNTVPPSFVHNLVGTALLKSTQLPFDLEKIAELVPNMYFGKQKFAAITLRVSNPNCTILLFTSGKMVLTGCRSFVECVIASHDIMAFLQIGFPTHKITLMDVMVQNVVGNSDVNLGEGDSIDLNLMLQENKVYCTYLRNMFPGLIYRPKNSPVVLLIFKSGKVVITGGKSLSDIKIGWASLWDTVKKYIVRSKIK